MVAVATGIEKLDEELQHKFSEAGHECRAIYFRDFLTKTEEKVVILSPKLEGTIDFDKLLYELRRQDKRVILLLDKADKKRIKYAISLGIYDIVYDPITADLLLDIYFHPKTFGDIVSEITGPEDIVMDGEIDERKDEKEEEGSSDTILTEREETRSAENFGKKRMPLLNLPKISKGIYKAKHEGGGDYRARLWLVIGSSPNCGATTLAMVLAQKLSEKKKVRLIDAGGGISKNASQLECEVEVLSENRSPVLPWILTIADVGYIGSESRLLPFAEAAIIVTDGSEESAAKVYPIVSGRTYLVGMRGATEEEVFSIATLKRVTPAVVLPDIAMKSRPLRIPQAWNKPLARLIKILEEETVYA